MLEDRKHLESRTRAYTEKGLIAMSRSHFEIAGHMEKARHNLGFIKAIGSEFNDWKLVVCYYAAYHAALALIISKGFTSKNHDATLCLLMKHFYNSGLSKEDIELLNMFDAEDLLFYVESKQKREDAQYSTKTMFDIKDIEKIRIKTILFVSKAENMIG